MHPPKEITLNRLGKETLTVTVRMTKRLKLRIQLALLCVRVAAWILGHEFAVKEVEDQS